MLFLSDIFPTGYMGAEMCNIKPGDTVAVWGCGPVGQFAIASAKMLGAERVIAIDRFEDRLGMARNKAGATDVINYEEVDVYDTLMEMTGGRGTGRLHRRGRHRSACRRAALRLRPGQAGADARNRSSVCVAPGDHGVPQRRHGVGHRRIRRVHRQVPDGLGHEPLADDARPGSVTCIAT